MIRSWKTDFHSGGDPQKNEDQSASHSQGQRTYARLSKATSLPKTQAKLSPFPRRPEAGWLGNLKSIRISKHIMLLSKYHQYGYIVFLV